jgi:predicted dehydrogenase
MNTYRAAVIGLTGIGAGLPEAAPDPVLGTLMPHSHVAAYAAIPRTSVVAVCDLYPALVERCQGEWRPRFPELRGYTDYRELLAKERIDLLSIVTSDDRHAQIAVDAVEAGVKGIFCEKPVATTLADADRMIAACRRAGVPLVIDHTRRWWPEFAEARRLLRAGAIGPLQRVMASLGGPRAMLFRNGTHLIDTICYFAESEPTWVVGELDDEHRDYPPRYAGDGGRDPATDPGGSAWLLFQNGVRAFASFSKGTIGNFEIDLQGERGRIRVGAHVFELWRYLESGELAITPLRPPATTRGDMQAAIEELIGLIENGGTNTSSGEDGRRDLSILLGILQSSAAGGTRVQFPVRDA